ncbi:hypothetical protein GLOIN_2v1789185 [Rhizophagus irregularis DAOM 181602=DAOM 197198]|uniref:Uncharacterized protein n=1 Tax=Rhizophagus irregularis (strain DAOM 197198w) TaxID=1432141 RepID=A0A015K2X3_RHIIW|nr:hypothetical protein RirG_168350 [Rhizophagus irregularis DAOM 197198w]GBC18835.1 hypothetical protein GLOIN_2v1789185 [Rhizophagus irregularis DAOM 181602=DAOM 197198]
MALSNDKGNNHIYKYNYSSNIFKQIYNIIKLVSGNIEFEGNSTEEFEGSGSEEFKGSDSKEFEESSIKESKGY